MWGRPVSVRDINNLTVLAAIRDGHDTAGALASHFEVLPASHTLRSVVTALAEQGRISIDKTDRQQYRYTATDPTESAP